MGDVWIAAIGRLVVEAREDKGWSQLQLSKETGIFLEPLRRLEDGKEWMADQPMEAVEEALGWHIGITHDIRNNAEWSDVERLTLTWVEARAENHNWGSGSGWGLGAALLPTSELLRELGDRLARLEAENREHTQTGWGANWTAKKSTDPWCQPADSDSKNDAEVV